MSESSTSCPSRWNTVPLLSRLPRFYYILPSSYACRGVRSISWPWRWLCHGKSRGQKMEKQGSPLCGMRPDQHSNYVFCIPCIEVCLLAISMASFASCYVMRYSAGSHKASVPNRIVRKALTAMRAWHAVPNESSWQSFELKLSGSDISYWLGCDYDGTDDMAAWQSSPLLCPGSGMSQAAGF